jgi:hypothetical protein
MATFAAGARSIWRSPPPDVSSRRPAAGRVDSSAFIRQHPRPQLNCFIASKMIAPSDLIGYLKNEHKRLR